MLAGLALADDAWRWAEASRQGGFDVAHEPLQPGWVVNGLIVALEPVQLALIRLVDRLALRATGAKPPARVAMSLPSSAVLMHRTWVPPHLSEAALQALCREQATDWLPLPLSEMVLEAALNEAVMAKPPRGEDASEAGGLPQAVWVAATRLERVTQALSLSEAAGLTLCVLETESALIVERCLRAQWHKKPSGQFGLQFDPQRGPPWVNSWLCVGCRRTPRNCSCCKARGRNGSCSRSRPWPGVRDTGSFHHQIPV